MAFATNTTPARLALFLLASAFTLAVNAAGPVKTSKRVLYKFRDDAGAMVLKDYLPPEVVARGYTIVNEYGQTLEVIEPVKTREQMAAERESRAKLEAEQRIKREAAKHDAELLRQFTTVEDIMRARDTQLASLDVQISIRSGQSNLITSQLEDMQKHAADFERRGAAVPAQLLKDIQESQRQIGENQGFIEQQGKEKEKIADRFKADIVRFKELNAQRVLRNRNDDGSVNAQNTSLFSCSGQEQCRKAWQLAQIYARDNATRSLEIVTDTLIMTGKPSAERDLALALSKVPDKTDGAQIVLEASCISTSAGQAFCSSDAVKTIVDKFPDYLNSTLN